LAAQRISATTAGEGTRAHRERCPGATVSNSCPGSREAELALADPMQPLMFRRSRSAVRQKADIRHVHELRMLSPELSSFRLMDVQGRVVREIIP